MDPRPTLKSVAAQAHVSVSTVSAILNGTGRFSEATRRAVEEAARQQGYRPHAVARRLRSGQSRPIVGGYFSGLLDDSNDGSPKAYWQRVVYTLVTELSQQHIDVRVFDGDADLALVMELDVIVAAYPSVDDLQRLVRRGFRGRFVVACIEKFDVPDDIPVTWVTGPVGDAIFELLDHIVDCGFDRPAWILEPLPMMPVDSLSDAYCSWCASRGRQGIISQGPFSAESVDAVLAAGADSLVLNVDDSGPAASVVGEVLDRRGLRVPADIAVAVIGEDLAIPVVGVPMTTLTWEARKAAVEVAAMVSGALSGGPFTDTELTWTVHRRQSTNPG